MNAYALQEKSAEARIFSIDRGIIARENASDNPDVLDWNYAQNLGRLLNPSEVAEVLGISRSSVYKMIERGQIPSIKIGRLVRVEENDLYRTISKFRR